MNAVRATLLPQISNRIQPNDPGSASDIEQQYLQHLQQQVGVGPIQIDLVAAKRGPDMALATRSLEARKQRRLAGTSDKGMVFGRVPFDEVTAAGRPILEVFLKPAMPG